MKATRVTRVVLLVAAICGLFPPLHGRSLAQVRPEVVGDVPSALPVRGLESLTLDSWTTGFFSGRLGVRASSTDIQKVIRALLAKSESDTSGLQGFYSALMSEPRVNGVFATGRDLRSIAIALFDERASLRRNREPARDKGLEPYLSLLEVLAEEVLYAEHLRFPSEGGMFARVYSTDLDDCPNRHARLNGMEICQGDVLASKGGAGTSSFLARMGDRPGNFSHATIAYVDPSDRTLKLAESFIEDGVKLRDAQREYAFPGKRKLFIYRYQPKGAKDRKQVIAKAIEGVDQFVDLMRSRSGGRPDIVASFKYDFNMDALSPNRDDEYFCSEIPVAIYRNAGLADAKNPFPRNEWSQVSGTTERFFRNFLGIRHNRFPAPSDIDFNPEFTTVGLSIDPGRLGADRLDVAMVDTLIQLATTEVSTLERFLELSKAIPDRPITAKEIERVRSLGIIPPEELDKYVSTIPDNIGAKQLIFFGYLDMVLTPRFRAQMGAIEAAHLRTAGTPFGLNQLRAQSARILKVELSAFIAQVENYSRAAGL